MTRGLVCIVDDDLSMREALTGLFLSTGYSSVAFDSAAAFVATDAAERGLCVVLDVCMPTTSGLELQAALLAAGRSIPIIFMTARPDDATEQRALASGARAFLTKPLDHDALLAIVDGLTVRP